MDLDISMDLLCFYLKNYGSCLKIKAGALNKNLDDSLIYQK